MEKDMSKSTKNEILVAYNELLAKVKEQKPIDRQTEKKKHDEKEIVESASGTSMEKIVKNLANIKVDIVNSLDALEEKLIAEYKTLTGLQQSITIEKRNLEEVHEIAVNADSLAALLLAQKERKEKFESEINQKRQVLEEEIAEKRLQWKKEQAEYESTAKEKDALSKKEKQRAEEEYNYNFQLKKKKESDEYEAKKTSQEKELQEKREAFDRETVERESVLAAKEKEYNELKAKAVAFPSELEKAVKDTEKAVLSGLEIKYKHEAALLSKEIEGERKLNKQMVASLEAKIKEQDEMIRQLTQRTSEAGLQVRDIAVKAIEGASGQRVIIREQEKGE
ncbi:MAG: hypothetical protein HQK96_21680 [Nitrospirae bacterium]|nr:hypothetical protein [Nitrospirota bacterium]